MIRLLPVGRGELIVIEVNLPDAGVVVPICMLLRVPSVLLETTNPKDGVNVTF